MYVVEPDVIGSIAPKKNIDFPDILKKQSEKGKRVAIYPILESDWIDMGEFSLKKHRT